MKAKLLIEDWYSSAFSIYELSSVTGIQLIASGYLELISCNSVRIVGTINWLLSKSMKNSVILELENYELVLKYSTLNHSYEYEKDKLKWLKLTIS